MANLSKGIPYSDDFLSSLSVKNYSTETVLNYERDLSMFSRFLGERSCPFDKISNQTIEDFKAHSISTNRKTAQGAKSLEKLSAGSINRTLSSLRSYFKYLVDMDYRVPVSSSAIKLLKMPRTHARVAELDSLVELIESPLKFEKNKRIALQNRMMLETLFATR